MHWLLFLQVLPGPSVGAAVGALVGAGVGARVGTAVVGGRGGGKVPPLITGSPLNGFTPVPSKLSIADLLQAKNIVGHTAIIERSDRGRYIVIAGRFEEVDRTIFVAPDKANVWAPATSSKNIFDVSYTAPICASVSTSKYPVLMFRRAPTILIFAGGKRRAFIPLAP